MAAILDFIHNAMSKVLSYYTTMSGITEARMLDTKICVYSIENSIILLFHLVQMGAVLDSVTFRCLK